MDLLERYLQEVGKFLPQQRRADILRELGENLREEMENFSESLGRPLNDSEQADILKRHGHPLKVAARYGTISPLIGAEIAPFYWFTLSKTGLIVAAILAFSRAVTWINSSGQPFHFAWEVLSFFHALLVYWAIVTLCFAVAEWWRRREPEQFVTHWDPRKLPVLSRDGYDLSAHPRIDLPLSVLLLVWLLAFPHFPVLILGPGVRFLDSFALHPAPVLYLFYWLIVALNCMQIVFKIIALRGLSTRVRQTMKLVEQAFSLGALLVLLRSSEYLVVDQSAASFKQSLNVVDVNHGIHTALEVVAVIAVIRLAWDLVQIFSQWRSSGTLGAAAF